MYTMLFHLVILLWFMKSDGAKYFFYWPLLQVVNDTKRKRKNNHFRRGWTRILVGTPPNLTELLKSVYHINESGDLIQMSIMGNAQPCHWEQWFPLSCWNFRIRKSESFTTPLIQTVRLSNTSSSYNQPSFGGAVRFKFPGIYTCSCDLDVMYFPFDKQNCSLIFGSWIHDSSGIIYNPESDQVRTENYIPSEEWTFISFTMKEERRMWGPWDFPLGRGTGYCNFCHNNSQPQS